MTDKPEVDPVIKLIAERAPDRFEERGGKLFAKFDRICIVHADAIGRAIVQFQLKGEVVNNLPLPPELQLNGEITIDEIEGWHPITLQQAENPDAASSAQPQAGM